MNASGISYLSCEKMEMKKKQHQPSMNVKSFQGVLWMCDENVDSINLLLKKHHFPVKLI